MLYRTLPVHLLGFLTPSTYLILYTRVAAKGVNRKATSYRMLLVSTRQAIYKYAPHASFCAPLSPLRDTAFLAFTTLFSPLTDVAFNQSYS